MSLKNLVDRNASFVCDCLPKRRIEHLLVTILIKNNQNISDIKCNFCMFIIYTTFN